MTSDEIRIGAQLLTGFKIESVTGFTWVKDAMNYIVRHYPLAGSRNKVTVSVAEKGDTYQINKELIRLEKITKHNKRSPLMYPEYECTENGLITFYAIGTFDITYLYVPDLPLTVSDNLNIPDRYAEQIKYYLSARIRGRQFGIGDAEAQQYDSMFQTGIADAEITMARINKRHTRMPARF